jgi:cation:H+ antiporter
MILDILSIAVGLAALFIGGEWLVRSASRLATSFRVPSLIIGLTIVSLGTSAPELLVSVSAALGGSSDIALGNVLGSNVANIGLILGLAGLIYPLTVHEQLIRREIPVMITVSALLWLMCADGEIGQLEGLALVLGYAVFTFALYYFREKPPSPKEQAAIGEIEEEVARIQKPEPPNSPGINRLRETGVLVVGLVLLAVGAQFTVNGAVNIARALGISELVIGLTLVAVGTSLPEIVTSVVASIRRHSDIAVGNVIGSNIANILAILGITAFIRPVQVAPELNSFEFPAMMFFAILVVPFAWNRQLGRWESAAFLAAYGVFVAGTLL